MKRIGVFLASCALGLTLVGCDVDQTEEGDMPDVDVNVEGGSLPEYDVETADIDVKTEEKTVTVPDVDIKTEEKEISVPDVDITMPDEGEAD